MNDISVLCKDINPMLPQLLESPFYFFLQESSTLVYKICTPLYRQTDGKKYPLDHFIITFSLTVCHFLI